MGSLVSGIASPENRLSEARIAGIRRVLIYRLGSFGDTVVLLPCLHQVAKVFAQAERRMLTNVPVHGKAPAAAAVIGDTGLVHSYINYAVGERNPIALLKIVLAIRRFKPDLLIYLASPRGEAVLARDQKFFRLAGISRSRIIGLPEGDLALNLPQENGMWEHEAARLARTIAPLGPIDTHDPRSFDMCLNAAERNEASMALAPLAGLPLIACGPGTKMQAKDWGVEKWQGLLDALAVRFPKHALVMIGAADDYPVAQTASLGWEGRRLNLCGKLSPRGSAAVLAQTELFMGPDSGPMHVASAVGVAVASPFASRTRRGMWFPIGNQHQIVWHELSCSNCNLETCIQHERRCLSSITVAEMVEAALAAWKAGKAISSQPVETGSLPVEAASAEPE